MLHHTFVVSFSMAYFPLSIVVFSRGVTALSEAGGARRRVSRSTTTFRIAEVDQNVKDVKLVEV